MLFEQSAPSYPLRWHVGCDRECGQEHSPVVNTRLFGNRVGRIVTSTADAPSPL